MNSPFIESLYYMATFSAGALCLRGAFVCLRELVTTIKESVQAVESYRSARKLAAEEQKIKAELANVRQREVGSNTGALASGTNAIAGGRLPVLSDALRTSGCEFLENYKAPEDWILENPVVREHRDELIREASAPLAMMFEGLERVGCKITVEIKILEAGVKKALDN